MNFSNIYEKKKSVHVQSTHSVVIASGGTEELERHLSPLYGEKMLVDKTVTVCRHCGSGLHWDWVLPGQDLAGAGG